MADTEKNSHKQILKATGIVGGAKVVQILIRIIRTKVIAVLLGPAGMGIAGLYYSTIELVKSITGLGLDFSAVRDVAEAAGTGDQQRIGRTIIVLRRWVWLTGILGLSLVLILHRPFSRYAFEDNSHGINFILLAFVPLFSALSGGQIALLRGIRRIGDMARAGVLGSAAGLVITVPFYWVLGVQGIVPALILTALAELMLSWHFAKKIKIQKKSVSLKETISGGTNMIKLGLFTVITSLATTSTMYLVRIFISSKIGVEGVGQFQAAWNFSAIYVGLILSAMAADYFPRLSAVNKDNVQVCRIANEQTEIALLLAGPLVVGMISFMDLFVFLFYSTKFSQSIDILLWQTMGNLLKVIVWPMGFVLLAKNYGGWFVFTEIFTNCLLFGTIWFLWNSFGLESIGIAFVVIYVANTLIVFTVCSRLFNYTWSSENKKMIIVYVVLALISFLNVKLKLITQWRIISFIIFGITMIYSYIWLKRVVDFKLELKKLLQKISFLKY